MHNDIEAKLGTVLDRMTIDSGTVFQLVDTQKNLYSCKTSSLWKLKRFLASISSRSD